MGLREHRHEPVLSSVWVCICACIGTVTFAVNNFVFQITLLGVAGGLTVKETVWRVMARLMTNQLAKLMNWRGINGKCGFESLAIHDVVLSKLF